MTNAACSGSAPVRLCPPGASYYGLYDRKVGDQSARLHTHRFNPFFESRFGVRMVEGSFNLWLDEPQVFANPLRAGPDEFWPIILAERAIGVVFRQGNDTPEFLEVFSPVMLRDRLGMTGPNTPVTVRVLDVSHFSPTSPD